MKKIIILLSILFLQVIAYAQNGSFHSENIYASDSLVGNIYLLNTTVGNVGDSLLCKNAITGQIGLRPPAMVVPVTNVLVVDGKRTDIYIPDGSSSRPYKNIQQAIDTANVYAADTNRYVISINPSIYVEDITMAQFVSLRGSDIESTIIEGTVTWGATNLDLAGNEIAILTVSQYNAPAIICTAGENAYMGVRSCYITTTWDNDANIKYVIKTNSGYLEMYATTFVENFVTNQGNGGVHESTIYYDGGILGSGLSTKLFSVNSSHNMQVADTTDNISLLYSSKDNAPTTVLIKDGYFQVALTEVMTIDVQPAIAWQQGDVIVGQTSGASCKIIEQITPTTYMVSSRDSIFASGEIIGVVGNYATQGLGFPDFGNPHNQNVSCVYHYQSKGNSVLDNNYIFVDLPYGNNVNTLFGFVRDSYAPSSHAEVTNNVMDIMNVNKSYVGASTSQYDQLTVNYSQISTALGTYPTRDTLYGYAGLYDVISVTNDDITVGGRLQASKLVVGLTTVGRGAISVGAGGTAVTGINGTHFVADFLVGDIISSEGQTQTVVSVIDNTNMTTTAWGAGINVKGYNITGGTVFEANGNGNVYVNGKIYVQKLDVADTATFNSVTILQKMDINDSLLVHGNTKIDSSLVVVQNITGDTLKPNVIEFFDNSIQTTAGYTSADTTTILATKYDLTSKENILTFTQPLQRSVNTISLNDTIPNSITVLGNIKADTTKVDAVKFADNTIQDTKAIPYVSATSGQILSYNGSAWVAINNAIPVSAGSPSTLFYEDSASNIPIYESLWSYPLGAAEAIESKVVNADTLLIDAYATDSLGLGVTLINAGIWQFNTFAKVNDTSGLSEILFKVYHRTGVTESLMFTASTGKLISTTVLPYSTVYVDSAHVVTDSTRLVVKVYAARVPASNRTVDFYHGGTTNYSNVITPLPVLHNDLAGLEGGGSGEYYHLTKTQDSIATQSATGSRDGYLTSSDWTIFNNKVAFADTTTTIATRYDLILKANKSISISSGTGLTGGGDLSTNRTISADSTTWIPTDYDVSLKVPKTTTISTTAPLTGGGALSGNITLAMPVATNVADGYLSSTDWTTFNAKEFALTFSTGLTRSVNTITNDLSTGVSGGQTAIGGTALGNSLTLSSTLNATKGNIRLGTSSAQYFNYNENTNVTTIGNSSTGTNYAQFATDGSLTLVGTARKYKEIQMYPYNIYPNAGTYNTLACAVATTTAIGTAPIKFIATTFSGTTATPQAAIMAFALPTDYENGTDIIININWTTATSTALTVRLGVGLLCVGLGESLNGTLSYVETTITPNPTQYLKQVSSYTFTGTGFVAGDNVSVVVYRNPSNAGDTYASPIQVSMVELKYIANKIGE